MVVYSQSTALERETDIETEVTIILSYYIVMSEFMIILSFYIVMSEVTVILSSYIVMLRLTWTTQDLLSEETGCITCFSVVL